jgi:heterogeneous nuclear ribonucleoprotein R
VLFPKFPWNFELWKMPRDTENAVSTNAVDPVEPEERLKLDDDEEEEVEYEEIEEEVEEYEEVEEEEDPEETEPVHEADEDGKKKHAELLALPPHGSEVYIGGIAGGVSSEDLKKLCQSVGEVVEVSTANFLWVYFCICFCSAI